MLSRRVPSPMPVAAAIPGQQATGAQAKGPASAAGGGEVAELPPASRRLDIRVRNVMVFLWAAATLIVLLSLAQDLLIFLFPAVGFSDRIYRLDLDTEASLPTWFSSGLMLVCALALLAISLQAVRQGWLKAVPWFLMTAAFFALSLDEVVTLHEWLSGALSARMDNTGLFYFAWTLPALIVCLAGLACFVPFILSFSGLDRTLLIGSAVVFLSGALGMEMLGGIAAESGGIETFEYRLLATLEESLEFAGLLIFLLFLLRRLRADYDGLTLCFK